MKVLLPAIVVGLVLLVAWLAAALYLRSIGQQAMADEKATRHARLRRRHRRIVGVGIALHGIHLSLLAGTAMPRILPSISENFQNARG